MQIFLILLGFTAAIGFGAETPAQMATLRWSGDGEFRSWRWEKLGEAFGDGAARFAADSQIVSPTWAELDVLGAQVTLRCSIPKGVYKVRLASHGLDPTDPLTVTTVTGFCNSDGEEVAFITNAVVDFTGTGLGRITANSQWRESADAEWKEALIGLAPAALSAMTGAMRQPPVSRSCDSHSSRARGLPRASGALPRLSTP